MKEIIDKLTSCNIFNNLFPEIIFAGISNVISARYSFNNPPDFLENYRDGHG